MNTEETNQNETITKLVNKFGNDGELGREYRKLTITTTGKLDEFCLKYPNDFELGKFLRKKIYK